MHRRLLINEINPIGQYMGNQSEVSHAKSTYFAYKSIFHIKALCFLKATKKRVLKGSPRGIFVDDFSFFIARAADDYTMIYHHTTTSCKRYRRGSFLYK